MKTKLILNKHNKRQTHASSARSSENKALWNNKRSYRLTLLWLPFLSVFYDCLLPSLQNKYNKLYKNLLNLISIWYDMIFTGMLEIEITSIFVCKYCHETIANGKGYRFGRLRIANRNRWIHSTCTLLRIDFIDLQKSRYDTEDSTVEDLIGWGSLISQTGYWSWKQSYMYRHSQLSFLNLEQINSSRSMAAIWFRSK